MKKIIEYVPIITVCLIYFGFCNLYYFYKEFNIDIYNYVSNTEILLSFLPTIVISTSILYIIAYNEVVYNSDKYKKKEIKQDEQKESVTKSEENLEPKTEKKSSWKFLLIFPTPVLLLFALQAFINLILMSYFEFKNYELQEINLIYAVIFLLIVYFSSSLFKNQEIINENLLLICVFSVAYLGNQISTYRKLDADKIKDGVTTKEIEFRYNNNKIFTSKQNIYIGQTQSNLFLYNTKNKVTSVYKIENIDSMSIKLGTATNRR